jgi:hypothetical protein
MAIDSAFSKFVNGFADAALKQGFSIMIMLFVSAGLFYMLRLEKVTRETQVRELTKEIRDCQTTIVNYYREERQLTLKVIEDNTRVLERMQEKMK